VFTNYYTIIIKIWELCLPRGQQHLCQLQYKQSKRRLKREVDVASSLSANGKSSIMTAKKRKSGELPLPIFTSAFPT